MRKSVRSIFIITAGAIVACGVASAATPAPDSGNPKELPSAPATSDLTQRVLELIANHFGMDVRAVSPTADFVDELGASSMDCVHIIMEVEKAFAIDMLDEDSERIRNCDQLARYIAARQAEKPTTPR